MTSFRLLKAAMIGVEVEETKTFEIKNSAIVIRDSSFLKALNLLKYEVRRRIISARRISKCMKNANVLEL